MTEFAPNPTPTPKSRPRRIRDSLYVLLVLLVAFPALIALDSWLLPDYFPRATEKGASYPAHVIRLSVILVQSVAIGLVVYILIRRRTTPDNLRWHQYSLRGLLALMLLASIGMIPVAIGSQRANKQREAAEAVRKLGGSVSYDGLTATGEPPGPAWLVRLLGQDFFVTVGSVRLDKTKVTDAQLETLTGTLKGLPRLHWLSLEDTDVTDAGLASLKGLVKLQTLGLSHTKITGSGLANLKGLPQLQSLVLFDTPVADAGLEGLEGFAQLRTLALGHTKITDAGLDHLEGLPQLSLLTLDGTKVTREGIKKLRQALPRCKIIRP